MNYLDVVLGALLLWGLIRGFMKGLLVEIATLIGFVAGIYAAIHFSFYLSSYLQKIVSWEKNTINLVSFAVTFLIVICSLYFLGKALTKVADAATLGLMNKFMGAIFGLVKMGLILSALLLFFNTTNNLVRFVDAKTLEESKLYKPISDAGRFIFLKMIKEGNPPQEAKIEEATS